MPSVSALDMRYISQNGDEMRGDLEINENKIYLNHDKRCSLYTLQNAGRFIIKNPQSNHADSNVIKFYINDNKIHYYSKRVTDLMDPINAQDGCTKGYMDGQIAQTKIMLQSETNHLFSTCVQGKMLVIRFDLTRLQAFTVHRLSDCSEQNFFVISHRFKMRDNLWDARDNLKVEITVNDKFFTYSKESFISYTNFDRCWRGITFKRW